MFEGDRSFEIVGLGHISVVTVSKAGIHRRSVLPGSYTDGVWVPNDLAGEDEDLVAFADEVWTDDAVQGYKEANRPAPAPLFPNLEPDQFWFIVRVSGYEDELITWVSEMNDPDSESYDPMAWAAASSKLQFAKHFEHDHPFIDSARAALGIPSEHFDALWRYGSDA